jgi:hypothetical protein
VWRFGGGEGEHMYSSAIPRTAERKWSTLGSSDRKLPSALRKCVPPSRANG